MGVIEFVTPSRRGVCCDFKTDGFLFLMTFFFFPLNGTAPPSSSCSYENVLGLPGNVLSLPGSPTIDCLIAFGSALSIGGKCLLQQPAIKFFTLLRNPPTCVITGLGD